MTTPKGIARKIGIAALLTLWGWGAAGCGPRSSDNEAVLRAQGGVAGPQSTPEAMRRTDSAVAVPFDFYLLNLSWSPEFCVTHPSGVECSRHRGFIVHGLWPQNSDGSYPQHCGSRPGPTNPAAWADVMPDVGLVRHEWQTHGTCTPYGADTYFGMIRKAFQEVKVPAVYVDGTQEVMMTPDAILLDFAKVNPGFPAGSIALSCGNNRLTAVEVCMTKDLQPMACSKVRSCRANVVRITPVN